MDALAHLELAAFPAEESSPWRAESLHRELVEPASRIFVLEPEGGKLDGRVLGYLVFRVVLDDAELLRIAVEPAGRRRGLGTRLLAESLDRLGKEGVTTVHLEVRADNRAALALYRRLGFRRTGHRAAYYPDGADALVLSRSSGTLPGLGPPGRMPHDGKKIGQRGEVHGILRES